MTRTPLATTDAVIAGFNKLRNAQDATLINVRAAKKRIAKLEQEVRTLKRAVAALAKQRA